MTSQAPTDQSVPRKERSMGTMAAGGRMGSVLDGLTRLTCVKAVSGGCRAGSQILLEGAGLAGSRRRGDVEAGEDGDSEGIFTTEKI